MWKHELELLQVNLPISWYQGIAVGESNAAGPPEASYMIPLCATGYGQWHSSTALAQWVTKTQGQIPDLFMTLDNS